MISSLMCNNMPSSPKRIIIRDRLSGPYCKIRITRSKNHYNIARALVLSHSVYVSVLKIPIVLADSVSKLLRKKCFVFRASGHCSHGGNIDYFMVGERVRFLFTSCEESQTNERVFERVSLRFFTTSE